VPGISRQIGADGRIVRDGLRLVDRLDWGHLPKNAQLRATPPLEISLTLPGMSYTFNVRESEEIVDVDRGEGEIGTDVVQRDRVH
jgi:hypothetical protein